MILRELFQSSYCARYLHYIRFKTIQVFFNNCAELGDAYKRRPQSGGGGGEEFFRCGRLHFLVQKLRIFRNLRCVRICTDNGGEVKPVWTFCGQGGGVNFSRFVLCAINLIFEAKTKHTADGADSSPSYSSSTIPSSSSSSTSPSSSTSAIVSSSTASSSADAKPVKSKMEDNKIQC